MISIVITSFNEHKTIQKAIDSIINQNIKEKYELIIAAPDSQTQKIVEDYKNKKIKFFKDPGKGKSYAINLLLSKLKGEILFFTDGDVYLGKDSINELLKIFQDKEVGCVSGKPIPQNSRNNLFGYWAHMLCEAANKLRKSRAVKGEFLECSGYFWAFRNNIIKNFPLDVAEDTIVPIFFWLKNYKIAYSQNAKVYVKFPENLNDFIKQKRRAVASHSTIFKYVDPRKIPRMKTFKNELFESYNLFSFPKNIKEFFYTLALFPIRFYIWANLFYHEKFKKRYYKDAWKRVESTK